MAVRFKKKGRRSRTFIAQWREFRGLSQEDLADRMGTTGASVSRVESGRTPYSQDWLEAAAEVLGCTPADLISRDPRASANDIDRAIELLQSSQRASAGG
jgi:transcriptional regulator with XRE-family HTH domain